MSAFESVGFSKLRPPEYFNTLSTTIKFVESSPDTPTVIELFSGSLTENEAISSVFSLKVYEDSKPLITGGLFTSRTVILISSLIVVYEPSSAVIDNLYTLSLSLS